MSLTPEWRGRIEHWQKVLKTLIFRKLGDVPLQGFVTREQLTPAQGCSASFGSQMSHPATGW